MHCSKYLHGFKPIYRCKAASKFSSAGYSTKSPFRPKTAVVLSKVTRYEFEKHRFPDYSEKQLRNHVRYISDNMIKV